MSVSGSRDTDTSLLCPPPTPCLTGGQEMGGGQFNKPGTVKGGVHVYACRVAMVTHGELRAFIHSVHVIVTDSDCMYMSSVWEVYV